MEKFTITINVLEEMLKKKQSVILQDDRELPSDAKELKALETALSLLRVDGSDLSVLRSLREQKVTAQLQADRVISDKEIQALSIAILVFEKLIN